VPLGLPTSAVILDVGCGPGLFLSGIRERGYSGAFGVTLSPEDAQACRAAGRGPRAAGHGVIESDFSDIALPSRQVDFIWCRHSLEHSPYPLFTLFEYNRLLRPGGRMLVEVPAPDTMRRHEANPNHYSVLGVVMWLELFSRAGFVVERQAVEDETLRDTRDGRIVEDRNLVFLVRKAAERVPG
jgi:SAM-dependent methyltransferase